MQAHDSENCVNFREMMASLYIMVVDFSSKNPAQGWNEELKPQVDKRAHAIVEIVQRASDMAHNVDAQTHSARGRQASREQMASNVKGVRWILRDALRVPPSRSTTKKKRRRRMGRDL